VFPETTYETRFQNDVLRLTFINKASLSMMLYTPISSSSKAMGKVVLLCHPVSVVFSYCSILCNSDSCDNLYKASFESNAPLASTRSSI
jgi:hypothetical protein